MIFKIKLTKKDELVYIFQYLCIIYNNNINNFKHYLTYTLNEMLILF